MNNEGAVLLVDDDVELRDCLQDELEESGFVVRAVGDGGAALHLLHGWLPDLIVLDLDMPRVNGWEFRVQQLGDERLAAIPLLAMSADRSAKAAAIDSDGFLQKPFSTDQLFSRIDAIMSPERHPARPSPARRVRGADLIHEINDSLSVVQGGLELIASGIGDLAPKQASAAILAELRADIDASRAAAQKLEGLIRDLRSLCAIPSGRH